MFRDVKQGYPVYLFDRKEVAMRVGKVTSVGMPHFDAKVGASKMVVDLTVEADGKSVAYVMDECGEVGYVGDMVVAVGMEAVLREVARVKNQSEEALKMEEYHRGAVARCEEIMKEYSTEYRDKAEATERMSTLEGKVDKMADMLSALMGKMDQERRETR